jgi:hypothetical protein
MARKRDDRIPRPEDAAAHTDTASYEHVEGAPDPSLTPERPLPKMPHERDESAHNSGDRLKEDPIPSGREISQALDDVEAGRVDTERRGIPDDVPSSKRNRES